MNRRAILCGLSLGALALAHTAGAQQAGKVYRIGVLAHGALAESALLALRQGLQDRGYVEGQNLIIERRDSGAALERLTELAAELVRLKVDVLVTSGAPAARAAKGATTTIPVVMAQINDPVGLGLVASLAKPGGNITGVANLHSELAGKQLELLKEAVPNAARVAVLWNPGNPGAEMIVNRSQRASRGLGVTLHPTAVRDRGELDGAFAAMTQVRVDAMFLPPDPFFLPFGEQIVTLAARHRLPAVYGWREVVDAGGLMGYGPNIPDLFRRAAMYVARILKGASPAELPIEQATKFELVINLKTAKALGLTIPPSLLLRADQVIE